MYSKHFVDRFLKSWSSLRMSVLREYSVLSMCITTLTSQFDDVIIFGDAIDDIHA